MRGKEEAADYRYFPEPDLLKAVIDDAMYEAAHPIPELPDAKRERFEREYGMNAYNAAVITSLPEMARYFETMVAEGASAKNSVTWLTVELLGRLKNGVTVETSPVRATTLALIVKRIEDGTISGKAAKEVLDFLMEHDESVDAVIEKLGLKQVSDSGALEKIVDEVLAANPDKVAEYRSGKDKLFGFFVGQVMKASKGSANPQSVNDIVKAKLG